MWLLSRANILSGIDIMIWRADTDWAAANDLSVVLDQMLILAKRRGAWIVSEYSISASVKISRFLTNTVMPVNLYIASSLT